VVYAVEAGYLGVLVLYQTLPVEGLHRHIPAVAPGILEVLSEVRGVGKQLLGHAPHVDAGTSQIELFSHGHPGAKPSSHATCAHAAGACADDEKIKIKL